MADSQIDEDLEDLRAAILGWRFPMLIVGFFSGLMMLVSGLMLLLGLGSMVLLLGRGYGPSPFVILFQVSVSLALYGVVLMPVSLLIRAAVKGLQARTEPRLVLHMARLHERYWMWVFGIVMVYIAFTLVLMLLVGC